MAERLRNRLRETLELWSSGSMSGFSFVVQGPPVGYTIMMGRFGNTKRKRKYVEFKRFVQEQCPFDLPLTATKDSPVLVLTRAFFLNGTHPDPENVHKGIKDALFYGSAGAGDKYTGGSYSFPLYDKSAPRVEITVEFLNGTDSQQPSSVAREG